MIDKNKITGIILAGGKSSRMGFDKGLADVNGNKMIELVYAALLQVTDDVMIIANTNAYDYLQLPVYKDIFEDKGPIAGIYTGLSHSTTQKNLIVACDMPFVNHKLLQRMLEYGNNYEIVVPSVNGQMEPLCGFYKKEIAEQLKEIIEMNILSVHKAIEFFDYHTMAVNDTEAMENNPFANLNRPEDLQNYRMKLMESISNSVKNKQQ